MDLEILWDSVRISRFPEKFIDLMTGLYSETEILVKYGGGISDFFPLI